uniref:Uncharacterized protein n=1 Tax=Chromera velia CCMP2878 TaxID=1169474 RepID=A0A0G4I3V6_9ALVE|eukprot:Cvel_1766.t1-p1 / transcript=Cvel_1766.t1 / gene=Cvel_1766 / organism=Chromera_velia_CCMP2878 / gene_product=hypothetical protein / transcript_product=hypothetical protein / location=Cvel_scaffold64:115986-123397(-) / protein_length=359 / sequence_SO=supercontig / SO=protein_coding / is_pseudo=false
MSTCQQHAFSFSEPLAVCLQTSSDAERQAGSAAADVTSRHSRETTDEARASGSGAQQDEEDTLGVADTTGNESKDEISKEALQRVKFQNLVNEYQGVPDNWKEDPEPLCMAYDELMTQLLECWGDADSLESSAQLIFIRLAKEKVDALIPIDYLLTQSVEEILGEEWKKDLGADWEKKLGETSALKHEIRQLHQERDRLIRQETQSQSYQRNFERLLEERDEEIKNLNSWLCEVESQKNKEIEELQSKLSAAEAEVHTERDGDGEDVEMTPTEPETERGLESIGQPPLPYTYTPYAEVPPPSLHPFYRPPGPIILRTVILQYPRYPPFPSWSTQGYRTVSSDLPLSPPSSLDVRSSGAV